MSLPLSRSSLAHLAAFVIAVAGCATGGAGTGDSTVDPAAGGGGTGGDTDAGGVSNGSSPYESGDDAGSSTPSKPGSPGTPGKGDGGTTPSNPSGSDSGSTPPPNNPPPPSAPQAGAGDIVVSEVMYNPSGAEPDTEWFEIRGTGSSAVALDGLTIVDGSGSSHTISGGATPIVVNPGAYVVLARNKAAATTAGVPASAIVYQYAGVTLANGSTGHLTIKAGSTAIADVPFGSWTAASNGESIELSTGMPPATAGDWCFAGSSWSTGSDLGTPGAASDCP